jgi:hypothetical protein
MKLTFVNEPFNCDKFMFTLKSATGSLPMRTDANEQLLNALRTRFVKNGVAVAYELPQSGKVGILIVNANGAIVSSRQERFLSVGAHSEIVPLSGECPGVYFVRLTHSGIVEESRFIIAK